MTSLVRALVFASGLLLWACATTPEKKPLEDASASDTPEVPYQPRPVEPPTAASTSPSASKLGDEAPASTQKPSPPPPPQKKATNDPGALAAFQRAIEASNRGDVAAAQRELEYVVDRDDKLDYAWTNLGVLYERQALPDKAERAYQRALTLRPDQDMAWDYLVRLYCRSGRATRAEEELRAKIQELPAALGLRTALVFVLLHQSKTSAAAAEAKKVLKADERNVRAMQLLAQVYVREGKNELAKMVLENAKAIDPNDAATHNALGLVQLSLKARPAALESFRLAASLKPDFAEARNNFGALLNEAQDYESAVRELEAAVTAAPDFVSARMNLGNAYRGKQDFAKALAQYSRVERLSPNLPDTYFNLAILHLDSEIPNLDTLERYKTSIQYFEQYQKKGGRDERVEQYVKDAQRGIDKEERRREREKRDALKRVEREAAEKKKAEEEALRQKAEAEKKAAEEAKRAAEAAKKKKTTPASKLGNDEELPPAPASGKLGQDDK
ncbi:MAG: tetratricopeptide repeat protein [Myxococcota bacterium]